MEQMPPSRLETDNPLSRGYWTDEELLDWAGAGSIAIIKQMQRGGLLKAGMAKSETGSGQNARAWTIADVLRVATVVDLSLETGFNLATNVLIAGALGVPRLDLATAAQDAADAIREVIDHSEPRRSADRLPETLEAHRPDLLQLAIVDRHLVYALRRKNEDLKFEVSIIAEYKDNGGGSSELTARMKGPLFDQDVMHGERSVLRIKLANLAARPYERLRTGLREAAHAHLHRRR